MDRPSEQLPLKIGESQRSYMEVFMNRGLRRFANKTAVVTGGSAGIGKATTEEFLKEGASVVYTGISERGLEPQKNWTKAGYNVKFLRGDMGDSAFCRRTVTETIELFGKVDYLVNNAADFTAKGLNATREDWERILAVNIIGYSTMVQSVTESMKKADGGAIVNLSSISGYIAQPNRWTYNTTKAGILEMTRCQAMDLAQYNIRVNSVSPGWIWTPIALEEAGGDKEKWDPIWGKFHLMRRCGEVTEVARAILFLCSDDASFITGTDLAVDGGYLAMGSEGLGETSYNVITTNR